VAAGAVEDELARVVDGELGAVRDRERGHAARGALLEEKLLERRLRAHDSHTSVSSALAPRVARSAGCGSGGGRGLARGGGLVEERECRPAQQQAHRREALLLAACDDTASR